MPVLMNLELIWFCLLYAKWASIFWDTLHALYLTLLSANNGAWDVCWNAVMRPCPLPLLMMLPDQGLGVAHLSLILSLLSTDHLCVPSQLHPCIDLFLSLFNINININININTTAELERIQLSAHDTLIPRCSLFSKSWSQLHAAMGVHLTIGRGMTERRTSVLVPYTVYNSQL